MKMYLGSINDRVWEVTEHDFVILDPTNLTDNERANKQCNTMDLNTIYNGIDSKVFEQVKDLERASEVWTRLEETYEGTTTVKSAKLYLLMDKLSNFKMKDDESILEMFYRLQVIVNDLKSLGEKVKDEDFSHKFLMCLPKKFKTLRTIIFRGGLTNVSPNEVLGDVMTDAQYNDSDNKGEEKKDKKEKSVAFKASTSSSKGKSKKEASSEDDDDFDDEAMALLVCKMGKFMKKRGYGARKRRDYMKDNEDYSKEELIDIYEQLSIGYEKKRKKSKELLKKLKALEKSFGDLQASHECLNEDHEELGLAHTKLEKAHSSLLERAKEKETKEEQKGDKIRNRLKGETNMMKTEKVCTNVEVLKGGEFLCLLSHLLVQPGARLLRPHHLASKRKHFLVCPDRAFRYDSRAFCANSRVFHSNTKALRSDSRVSGDFWSTVSVSARDVYNPASVST
ncbi:uncharacterized protein [Miscanthus floridulus]|uniref:uncharacterized protein n=1 Tax=Miscanthus floridulus TaxID=154761 RepID=UPI0034587DFE